MKKFLSILFLTSLILTPVFATENVVNEQTIKNNQAYGTLNLQKQPQDGKQKQGISNHFTFFTINVQINGKIKDENTETK